MHQTTNDCSQFKNGSAFVNNYWQKRKSENGQLLMEGLEIGWYSQYKWTIQADAVPICSGEERAERKSDAVELPFKLWSWAEVAGWGSSGIWLRWFLGEVFAGISYQEDAPGQTISQPALDLVCPPGWAGRCGWGEGSLSFYLCDPNLDKQYKWMNGHSKLWIQKEPPNPPSRYYQWE